MFDDYIHPKYDTVISDSLQTKMGKAMWAKLAYHAFDKNQYVYGYDGNTGKLIRFTNSSDFSQKVRTYYGNEKKYFNLRLVISTNKL